MEPSLTELASALDRLVAEGRVVVTETREGLAVNQLVGAEAELVVALLEACAWEEITASDAGGEIPREFLEQTGDGVRVTAKRTDILTGIDAVLTQTGFAALLEREAIGPIIWVHGLRERVDTRALRFAPWGDKEPFSAQPVLASPAKVVRVLGPGGPGSQIDRWLLLEESKDIGDDALRPWRLRGTAKLVSALAQEIEPDGKLLFRGPPPTRFAVDQVDLEASSFKALQAATFWVFENSREVENRHGLLAAEIARASLRDGNVSDLAAILQSAFEGARIAYGFGVTQQSKDTLKALSDLRKAVSDDASKLSDTTRTLGAAIVGAIFGNIGLIVARITLPSNGVYIGPAAALIALVLTIYVAVIIGSGLHFISIQKELREDWRNRLYRFLADDEYDRMVRRPAARAERAFNIIASVGAAMAVILLIAVFFIVYPPTHALGDASRALKDASENVLGEEAISSTEAFSSSDDSEISSNSKEDFIVNSK